MSCRACSSSTQNIPRLRARAVTPRPLPGNAQLSKHCYQHQQHPLSIYSTMLRPLNPDQLLALADDDMDAGCMSIYMAKLFFQDQNLSNCVESLLRAFANELSRPVLTIHNYMCKDEKRGADEWSIAFWVHVDSCFWRLRKLIDVQCRIAHLHI